MVATQAKAHPRLHTVKDPDAAAALLLLGQALDSMTRKYLGKNDGYAEQVRCAYENLVFRVNRFNLQGELRQRVLALIVTDWWCLADNHPSTSQMRRLHLLHPDNSPVVAEEPVDLRWIAHILICKLGCEMRQG